MDRFGLEIDESLNGEWQDAAMSECVPRLGRGNGDGDGPS